MFHMFHPLLTSAWWFTKFQVSSPKEFLFQFLAYGQLPTRLAIDKSDRVNPFEFEVKILYTLRKLKKNKLSDSPDFKCPSSLSWVLAEEIHGNSLVTTVFFGHGPSMGRVSCIFTDPWIYPGFFMVRKRRRVNIPNSSRMEMAVILGQILNSSTISQAERMSTTFPGRHYHRNYTLKRLTVCSWKLKKGPKMEVGSSSNCHFSGAILVTCYIYGHIYLVNSHGWKSSHRYICTNLTLFKWWIAKNAHQLEKNFQFCLFKATHFGGVCSTERLDFWGVQISWFCPAMCIHPKIHCECCSSMDWMRANNKR